MQKLLKNLINLSLKQKISLLIIFSALFLITVFILNKTLFRYLVLSFIPLILTGYVFIKLQTRFKPLFLISGILIVAVLIHFRNTLFFSPTVYTDSNGYISWGNVLPRGLGFPECGIGHHCIPLCSDAHF